MWQMAYGEYRTDPLFTCADTSAYTTPAAPTRALPGHLSLSLSLSLNFSQTASVTWKTWAVIGENLFSPPHMFVFRVWTSLKQCFFEIREAIMHLFTLRVFVCVPERVTDSGGRCVCACVAASTPPAVFLSSIFSYTQRDMTLNQTLCCGNIISLDLFTNTLWTLQQTHANDTNVYSLYKSCTHTHTNTQVASQKPLMCVSTSCFYLPHHLFITLNCKREQGRKEVCVLSGGAPVSFWHFSFLKLGLFFFFFSSWSQRLFQLVLAKQALTWKLLSHWDTLSPLQVKDDILSLLGTSALPPCTSRVTNDSRLIWETFQWHARTDEDTDTLSQSLSQCMSCPDSIS